MRTADLLRPTLFRAWLDGRCVRGAGINFTQCVATGAVVPLGAEKACVAVDTFPGIHTDKEHKPVFQRSGSRTAPGRARFTVGTYRVHESPSTSCYCLLIFIDLHRRLLSGIGSLNDLDVILMQSVAAIGNKLRRDEQTAGGRRHFGSRRRRLRELGPGGFALEPNKNMRTRS